MKRTPLKRSTKGWPQGKSARRPLKAYSDAAREFNAEKEAQRPFVEARAGHRCEVCRSAKVEHLHHRLRKAQGGKNDLANLIGCCFNCHRKIHDYPALSYDSGLMLRRNP